VLVASVRASMEERFLENGLLRALGASRRLILGSLLAEFSLLGAAAGLLAVVGAELALWGLYREIFRIAPTWHPLLWLLAPPLGALLVGGTGLLVSRRVVSTPPMQVLREYG
jgi:putative ABC transport system permease protein